jgi:hypothetical protein
MLVSSKHLPLIRVNPLAALLDSCAHQSRIFRGERSHELQKAVAGNSPRGGKGQGSRELQHTPLQFARQGLELLDDSFDNRIVHGVPLAHRI